MIVALKTSNEGLIRAVTQPTVFELQSGRLAYFFIDGFVYFITLDQKVDVVLLQKYSMKDNGTLEIPILSGKMGRELLIALKLPTDFVNHFIPT